VLDRDGEQSIQVQVSLAKQRREAHEWEKKHYNLHRSLEVFIRRDLIERGGTSKLGFKQTLNGLKTLSGRSNHDAA
jgi:hypothetical protein